MYLCSVLVLGLATRKLISVMNMGRERTICSLRWVLDVENMPGFVCTRSQE